MIGEKLGKNTTGCARPEDGALAVVGSLDLIKSEQTLNGFLLRIYQMAEKQGTSIAELVKGDPLFKAIARIPGLDREFASVLTLLETGVTMPAMRQPATLAFATLVQGRANELEKIMNVEGNIASSAADTLNGLQELINTSKLLAPENIAALLKLGTEIANNPELHKLLEEGVANEIVKLANELKNEICERIGKEDTYQESSGNQINFEKGYAEEAKELMQIFIDGEDRNNIVVTEPKNNYDKRYNSFRPSDFVRRFEKRILNAWKEKSPVALYFNVSRSNNAYGDEKGLLVRLKKDIFNADKKE